MKKIILTTFAALLISVTWGQERTKEQLHSAMLYNFIKYIQWPNETSAGDFVVGVFGDDAVYSTLEKLYNGKSKGPKKCVIRNLSTPSEAAICDVVYLGSAKNRDFDLLKSAVKGKSVLTVTDGNGLGDKGSCINFKVVNGRLKFEMNQAVLGDAKLKVSGQLSSMAILL